MKQAPKIVVGPSTVCEGWGVFADEPIPQDEIIEVCSVFPFAAPDDVLRDHRLEWTETHDAMASGNACLYNHSDTPNVEFVKQLAKPALFVRALRDIAAGEELFKKYACKPWW